MRDPLDSANHLIETALGRAERPCLTCSFQAEDVALADLVRRFVPDVPVLFLDTGYHFAEVYRYRDRIVRELKLNLINLLPAQTVAEQETQFGILYQSNPSDCCHRRKVEPLMAGLALYDAWFTGLRREQSPTRVSLQPEEIHAFPNGLRLRKLSPLFDWTWVEVQSYLVANDIPELPLYAQGYTSIGCEPCTAKPLEGAHARSGRWGGRKLECGLHTVSQREA